MGSTTRDGETRSLYIKKPQFVPTGFAIHTITECANGAAAEEREEAL